MLRQSIYFIWILSLSYYGSVAEANDKNLSVSKPSENMKVEKLYQEYCSSCHGEDLQGGAGSALVNLKQRQRFSHKEIANIIKYGLKDKGMPAFDGGLSDKQIRALVIYINERNEQLSDELLLKKLSPKGGVFEALGHKFMLDELATTKGVFWSVDFLPDRSMLITEKSGVLWHYKKGQLKKIAGTPKVWHMGQGGLLEVGVHPNYKKNAWIYLSYSENKGGKENNSTAGMTAVVRGKIKRGKWSSQETIFTTDISLHSSAKWHFGSRFVFDQGYLYFAIGDRGRQPLVQNLSRPNGKIFRLHDDGRIPSDNPFVNTKGAMPSIWSYGHRNPQGMDLDTSTGLIWASEHGPRGGDEINLIEKGKNYGWPIITYGMNYNGTPITELTHKDGMEQPKHYWVPSIAVSGIDFYTGKKFPKWRNKMLVAGMKSNELHLLEIVNGEVNSDDTLLKDQGRIRDVATGPDGNIYLLLNSKPGGVARLVRMTYKK